MKFKFEFQFVTILVVLGCLLISCNAGIGKNSRDLQAAPQPEPVESEILNSEILEDLALDESPSSDEASGSVASSPTKAPFPGRRRPAMNGQGRPVPSLTASLGIGKSGDLLLQDVNLLGHLAHFDRERIPERVVHAKGAGAHGYFDVTHDISNYTRAALFAGVGKRTPIFTRFSTVGGESGSADTALDPRGFAVKFYTEQGNWDLVGNNLLIFPIRDPILFPSLIRSRKRNPQTHLQDPSAFWDFTSLRPETTLHTLHLFSDLGYPDGYRFMNGGGVHTFKFVNKERNAVYVKFHWLCRQGLRNLTRMEAKRLAGENPDYSTQDLFEAIDRKDFPSWELNIQVMTFEQAEKYHWNPFDITKEWLVEDFPLKPVGIMTLNRNPRDYFTEVEMAAFDPGNLVPGIEMSPDRMLQGRSFSYLDTQRYRLGVNFPQLAINRPIIPMTLRTYERDGVGMTGPKSNGNGGPNYFPNSYGGPSIDPDAEESSQKPGKGDIQRIDVGGDDNFSQPKIFLDRMCKWERERLVDNLADNLKSVDEAVRGRTISNFKEVDEVFSVEVKVALARKLAEKKNNAKISVLGAKNGLHC